MSELPGEFRILVTQRDICMAKSLWGTITRDICLEFFCSEPVTSAQTLESKDKIKPNDLYKMMYRMMVD